MVRLIISESEEMELTKEQRPWVEKIEGWEKEERTARRRHVENLREGSKDKRKGIGRRFGKQNNLYIVKTEWKCGGQDIQMCNCDADKCLKLGFRCNTILHLPAQTRNLISNYDLIIWLKIAITI